MRDFIYFAAAYGLSLSLTLLGVGEVYRSVGRWVDRMLFPKRWDEKIEEALRGGPIALFVRCPVCTGFWVALGGTYWRFPMGTLGATLREAIPTRVAWALAAAAIIWIVHVTLTKLGQYEV